LEQPRQVSPRPCFYEKLTDFHEDQTLFINNIQWQREFFHGLFEAAQRDDFHRLKQIAIDILKACLQEDVLGISGLNEAYIKGMKVGQALFGGLEKAYAR